LRDLLLIVLSVFVCFMSYVTSLLLSFRFAPPLPVMFFSFFLIL
jgi:hypothetical protein